MARPTSPPELQFADVAEVNGIAAPSLLQAIQAESGEEYDAGLHAEAEELAGENGVAACPLSQAIQVGDGEKELHTEAADAEALAPRWSC